MTAHTPTRVDRDDIEVTSTEKLLALVLTVFFLIGGVWVYSKLDEIGESAYRRPETFYTPSERTAVARAEQRARSSGRAPSSTSNVTREELELARESYRTALDAGRTAPGLEGRLLAAQRDFRTARRQLESAQAETVAAEPAANAAYVRTADAARARDAPERARHVRGAPRVSARRARARTLVPAAPAELGLALPPRGVRAARRRGDPRPRLRRRLPHRLDRRPGARAARPVAGGHRA